jgi:hypothetical protein
MGTSFALQVFRCRTGVPAFDSPVYIAGVLFEREKVEARFRDMPDDLLLRQMGEDLTALEREVALAEAGRRGLYLDARRVTDRDAPLEVAPGHGPLEVCARYFNPMDAQVLAACLQNAGLAAHVMDADTIFASGALLGSLPRGGVRVVVPESQLEDALRIRARYDAGEFAIDENFVEER